MESPFKPSDVFLMTSPPLADCFGDPRTGLAAAILVWGCQQRGDRWQPIANEDLGALLNKAASDAVAPVAYWVNDENLADGPNWEALEAAGGAVRGIDGRPTRELTQSGIEICRAWVGRTAPPPEHVAADGGDFISLGTNSGIVGFDPEIAQRARLRLGDLTALVNAKLEQGDRRPVNDLSLEILHERYRAEALKPRENN